MNKAVIFDLDDTLIYSHVFYVEARNRLVDVMEDELGLDPQRVLETLDVVEMQNVAEHGFSRHRFPKSLAETYRRLSHAYEMRPDERVARQLEAAGYGVYSQVAKVNPHTFGVLGTLRKAGYRLLLNTMGDAVVQVERIKKAKLEDWFTHIYIPPRKSASYLRVIVEDNDLDVEGSWVVGDSIRSDINPALEVGLNAILVKGSPNWHYNHAEVLPGNLWITHDLYNVPDIVLGTTRDYHDYE